MQKSPRRSVEPTETTVDRHDEPTRLALLQFLTASKSLSQRNQLGQFATPADLAREIIDVSLSYLSAEEPVRYLEPGFGTGPFFAALRNAVDGRLCKAVGYEIDEMVGEHVRQFWQGTQLQLQTADFLLSEPPQSVADRYNLIVSNPPYVRHHHLPLERKRDLQRRILEHTAIPISGLSGLYAYFMLHSWRWMSPGGLGVWLIPSEFMDTNYGQSLKEFLTSRVELLRIHRFDATDTQFDDALVSSAIVIFRNSPLGRPAQISLGGTLTEPRRSEPLEIESLRALRKWSALPGHRSAGRSLPGSRTSRSVLLSDFFQIKRGLATGSNDFFVMPWATAEKLGLPAAYLVPILPSPRRLKGDLIEATDDGRPCVENAQVLLQCDRQLDELQREFPRLAAYLRDGVARGIAERYLCRHRVPWYRQEYRPPAPFLCPYMGRRTSSLQSPFRFILNLSQATAANVYLMLYPQPFIAQWLSNDRERHRAIWNALRSIGPAEVMGEGRVYGGGLHKLEPKELARVDGSAIANLVDVPFNVDSCV